MQKKGSQATWPGRLTHPPEWSLGPAFPSPTSFPGIPGMPGLAATEETCPAPSQLLPRLAWPCGLPAAM